MPGRDEGVGLAVAHQPQPDDVRRAILATHRLRRRLVHPNRVGRINNGYVKTIDWVLRELGPHLRLGTDQDDRTSERAGGQHRAAHWLRRRVIAPGRI